MNIAKNTLNHVIYPRNTQAFSNARTLTSTNRKEYKVMRYISHSFNVTVDQLTCNFLFFSLYYNVPFSHLISLTVELEPFIGIQYINIYNVTKVSIISNILLRKKIFFFSNCRVFFIFTGNCQNWNNSLLTLRRP